MNRSQKSTKQALVHLDYEITHEALPHDSIRQLPLPVQERVKELYHLACTEPQQALSPLVDMIEKYPGVPVFYNYLRIAYEMTGQLEKADALLEVIYRKFPDYLFAKTNYAFRCLRMGKLEKIPEIFNRKFDLKLLYPHRVVFHLSEFTAFISVMALYHHVIGDHENAQIYYALLKRWAPNQELTQVVKSQLDPTLLQKLLDQLGMALSWIFETTEKGVKSQIDALEYRDAASSSPREVQFSKTF